ncbi:serum opacification factor [Streptococcus dysgalactiae]|uniref:serum opacification factor n=1 Tax=Streptococcus dysgalactiae TaxID=1334 RepID=UPI001CF4040A|nr:serum opacification factor [Streptococcus dysgalactiae]MCB2848599.1 serum opacification factor [Streptococcus dysgalactiae subsp. dysgalactiae]
MTNCKYKLRKLSIGLVSVGTMFMAAPVMGEDASQPTASRETSSASSATTSSTTQSGENQDLKEAEVPVTKALEVAEPTTAPKEAKPSSLKAEAPATAAEKGLAEAPVQEPAPKTPVQPEAASTTGQDTAPTNTDQAAPQESVRSRTKRSAEEPQKTMEVEKIQVDKEKSEVTVSDGTGKEKLIKNRDDKQRDIFDVKRDVVVDPDGKTLNVTLKVTPQEIDKGAEVIVLLDTSKKMTDADFKTAKENITKLVTTLTAKNLSQNDSTPNYNGRNSVRLIDFYRKVGESIDLSGLTKEKIEEKLKMVREKAQRDYNGWGVDLQGAIHKAREIFNLDKEKNSGKRQHIVLFSQGESTFSYALKKGEKENLSKVQVDGPVTYSNPLLFWPFYFNTTTKTHNVVEDAKAMIAFLNKFGITQFNNAVNDFANNGNGLLSFLNNAFGIKNPLDYITTADLDTSKLKSEKFDYSNQLGEGYNFRTYANREVDSVGFKGVLAKKIKENLKKFQPAQADSWLSFLKLNDIKEKIQDWMIDQALNNLFYRRQYQFYNHNLSAQAEAKMARDEGITFYAFDVTKPELFSKREKEFKDKGNSKYYKDYLEKKYEKESEEYRKRNEEFDKYLKKMSEGGEFFEGVDQGEKFKDILTDVELTETFTDKVTVEKDSWGDKSDKGKVQHKEASTTKLLFIFSSSTPESLTWTIGKEELKEAFEKRLPLTLTYKLNVNKEKFKSTPQTRAKRSLETLESSKATEKAISGKVTYKINGKDGTGKDFGEINVTYSKETLLVPEVFEEVEIPPTPEKPLVEPVLPSQPSIPEILIPEQPQKPLVEIEIGGQNDIKEFTEDSLPSVSGQNPDSVEGTVVEDTQTSQEDEVIIGGQGQVIDFTEDTQSGMSGNNSHTDEKVVEEDSKPSQEDEVIIGGQGQVIDFTEDTQSGMSGDNSHTDRTVLEEASKPSQEDEVIIGGQGQVIDFTEDTQTGMSGAGQVENPTITEETHKPEIIMGGQSDPIDMVEDTLPGMSGSNEATVVEEDTRPKLQFHFDNEEPVPATVPTVSQAPIAQVESKVPHAKAESALPQTGDTNKLETFFTITALTVIGAAGLLGKKRRDNQTD